MNQEKNSIGPSLVVQRLRLHTANAGSPGSILGQGTRSHMLQLNIPHAATKTQYSKYIIFKKSAPLKKQGGIKS